LAAAKRKPRDKRGEKRRFHQPKNWTTSMPTVQPEHRLNGSTARPVGHYQADTAVIRPEMAGL
jgi:hypothetical protein